MQIVPILTPPLTNQEKCNLRTIIVIAVVHQRFGRSPVAYCYATSPTVNVLTLDKRRPVYILFGS